MLEQLECLHVWPAQNRLLGAALFLHALPLAETVPRAHARVTFPAAAASQKLMLNITNRSWEWLAAHASESHII